MYQYSVDILRVIDGDTVKARIDLGCHTFVVQTLRLIGINAPELPTLEGRLAKEHLVTLVGQLRIDTVKDRTEKYGRYLARLYRVDKDGVEIIELNRQMITDGHATEYWP